MDPWTTDFLPVTSTFKSWCSRPFPAGGIDNSMNISFSLKPGLKVSPNLSTCIWRPMLHWASAPPSPPLSHSSSPRQFHTYYSHFSFCPQDFGFPSIPLTSPKFPKFMKCAFSDLHLSQGIWDSCLSLTLRRGNSGCIISHSLFIRMPWENLTN